VRSEERQLHSRFEHLRLTREWFTPESGLLDYIESLKPPDGTA
jgi:hypothetical protein